MVLDFLLLPPVLAVLVTTRVRAAVQVTTPRLLARCAPHSSLACVYSVYGESSKAVFFPKNLCASVFVQPDLLLLLFHRLHTLGVPWIWDLGEAGAGKASVTCFTKLRKLLLRITIVH